MSDEITIPQAFRVLNNAILNDEGLAHSWHCNIAMSCYDAMDVDAIDHKKAHDIANEAASRFMKLCFDVKTKAL